MMPLFLVLCLIFNSDPSNAEQNSAEDVYYPAFNISDPFDWKLFKSVAVQSKNVLISPLSVKMVIALLYQGATDGTQREIENILQFHNKKEIRELYKNTISTLQDSESTEYILNMGTALFVDSYLDINPTFENISKQSFRSDIQSVDFHDTEESRKIINNWVHKLTNGKVKKLVSDGDLKDSLLIATNAIYFKGTWIHPFQKQQTYRGNFIYPDANNPNTIHTIKVPFMSAKNKFLYKEVRGLDCKVLRLPYKGSRYSMFILLPNSLGGLSQLIKEISLTKIIQILYTLEEREVFVNIPKFKFNYKAKLARTLQDYGLRQMFGNTASFTGIIKANYTLRRQLFVTDVVQKTGIEVDEEGSVVFAATDVNIGNKFGEMKDVFNATHPFMFFIEGPNGTILFIGKVENPAEVVVSTLPNHFAHSESPVKKTETTNVPDLPENQVITGQNVAVNTPFISKPAPLEPDDYEQAEDTEAFSYRLGWFDTELLSKFSDSSNNVLISPASIKVTLAMLLEGATGNTATEIREALRIHDLNHKGIRNILSSLVSSLKEGSSANTLLESSNAIFPSQEHNVRSNYANVIKQFYNGHIQSINYRNPQIAAGAINYWVSDATRQVIRELVSSDSLSPDTNIVIANALYFKGKWQVPFDVKSTYVKCFNSVSGCINVPFLHSSNNFDYNFISKLRTHAVNIPFKDKYSMLILLPAEDSNIRSLLRDLPHFKLLDLLSGLKSTEIIFEMPKFQFENSIDLVDTLKSMKIRDLFGSKANLSGIVEGGNIFVSNLIHKTKIEVDEQGTVAAAATGAVLVPLMGSPSVIADRPFIFYIYHRDTANIIFAGILQNPQGAPQIRSRGNYLRNQYPLY